MQGLIKLMGGRKNFIDKLNTMFSTELPIYKKFVFLAQYPDMTGLIGMYSHGNEPTWHIPYLYNYAGAPWMTQKRVRQIMNIWYSDEPLGMSGDEDYGEMSSWYVLSAMGFYTVAPGRPVYDIGSPIFEKITINIGNGKDLNKPWFEHSDIVNGGTLVLNMGPRPNTEWGSAPEDAPPSMSRQ